MLINITITAADAVELRDALRQLLGDDQPAPATLAAAIADAVEVAEVADAPVPAATPAAAPATAPAAPAAAPAQQKRRGRPPKAARTAEAEAEAEAEIEQELADEPQPTGLGLEAAKQTVRDAFNGYVKIYGMDVAQTDILEALRMRFTDGSVRIVSDIPEGMHATVVQDIKDMGRTNFFKRKPV